MALTAVGTCWMSPTWPANAVLISSSPRCPAAVVASVSPSASSVFVRSPSRTVASYAFSVSIRWPSRRVARSMPSTSTPVAIGSSVPAWPTLRVPASRRIRETTSCEVIPAGLSTTTSPGSAIHASVGESLVLHRPRLAVRVLVAGVRRATGGSHRLVLGARLGEHLVEVARGLGQRVGHELQRGHVPHAQLLADLGADHPLGRLQRGGSGGERRLVVAVRQPRVEHRRLLGVPRDPGVGG